MREMITVGRVSKALAIVLKKGNQDLWFAIL